METQNEYRIKARHYLQRAWDRLAETSPCSLFYAALELRCGIEARLREYLKFRDDLTKARKQGWRIAKLAADVEEVYADSSKVMQFAIINSAGEVDASMWYVPVSPQLQKATEELNNLLHAQKRLRGMSDRWWAEKRLFLASVSEQLQEVCAGTLLGPPLQRIGSEEVRCSYEAPNTPEGLYPSRRIREAFESGETLTLQLRFMDRLPSDIVKAFVQHLKAQRST